MFFFTSRTTEEKKEEKKEEKEKEKKRRGGKKKEENKIPIDKIPIDEDAINNLLKRANFSSLDEIKWIDFDGSDDGSDDCHAPKTIFQYMIQSINFNSQDVLNLLSDKFDYTPRINQEAGNTDLTFLLTYTEVAEDKVIPITKRILEKSPNLLWEKNDNGKLPIELLEWNTEVLQLMIDAHHKQNRTYLLISLTTPLILQSEFQNLIEKNMKLELLNPDLLNIHVSEITQDYFSLLFSHLDSLLKLDVVKWKNLFDSIFWKNPEFIAFIFKRNLMFETSVINDFKEPFPVKVSKLIMSKFLTLIVALQFNSKWQRAEELLNFQIPFLPTTATQDYPQPFTLILKQATLYRKKSFVELLYSSFIWPADVLANMKLITIETPILIDGKAQKDG